MRLLKVVFLLTFLGGFYEAKAQNYAEVKEVLEQYQIQCLKLRTSLSPTLIKYGINSPEFKALEQKITAYDSVIFLKVQAILKSDKWLGKTQVGSNANSALFLLIQHQPQKEVRQLYLPHLKASAEAGESNWSDWATMYDRVQVEKGLKQKYGTQSFMREGELTLYPTLDIKKLNHRRKQVGLKKIKY